MHRSDRINAVRGNDLTASPLLSDYELNASTARGKGGEIDDSKSTKVLFSFLPCD